MKYFISSFYAFDIVILLALCLNQFIYLFIPELLPLFFYCFYAFWKLYVIQRILNNKSHVYNVNDFLNKSIIFLFLQ